MAAMANQRASDQVFIGIWVSMALAKKVEAARGGVPRSQWTRDAIAEYLRKNGFPVKKEECSGPNRVRSVCPAPRSDGYEKNEKPNSKQTSAAAKLARHAGGEKG